MLCSYACVGHAPAAAASAGLGPVLLGVRGLAPPPLEGLNDWLPLPPAVGVDGRLHKHKQQRKSQEWSQGCGAERKVARKGIIHCSCMYIYLLTRRAVSLETWRYLCGFVGLTSWAWWSWPVRGRARGDGGAHRRAAAAAGQTAPHPQSQSPAPIIGGEGRSEDISGRRETWEEGVTGCGVLYF